MGPLRVLSFAKTPQHPEFRSRNNVTSLSALLIQTDLNFGEGQHDGWHNAAEDDHQHREMRVYALKQTVEGQHEENQNDPADQFGKDAETEEPLMSCNVADRSSRVPLHVQLVGNIDQE